MSVYKDDWYKSSFVQAYNFKLRFGQEKNFHDFLDAVKRAFEKTFPGYSFISMKNISGEDLPSYSVMIALTKNENFNVLEKLFDDLITSFYSAKESEEILTKASNSIEQVESELWGYRSDLSMYP